MTDKQQKSWERRKEISKYYHDLSKLSFGALVVGEAVYWHNGEFSIPVLIIGFIATISFATISQSYLKV